MTIVLSGKWTLVRLPDCFVKEKMSYEIPNRVINVTWLFKWEELFNVEHKELLCARNCLLLYKLKTVSICTRSHTFFYTSCMFCLFVCPWISDICNRLRVYTSVCVCVVFFIEIKMILLSRPWCYPYHPGSMIVGEKPVLNSIKFCKIPLILLILLYYSFTELLLFSSKDVVL